MSPQHIHTQAAVKADVNRIISELYRQQITAAQATSATYAQLWRSIADLTFAGGKRLRPYVTVCAYEMYGGRNYQAILPIATAQELLHVSLLIHDDITDRDTVRYGVDNICGHYRSIYAERGASDIDARHYAESAALLAGDLILSAAHTMVLDSALPDQKKLMAQRMLGASVFQVAAGQLLDFEASMSPMAETDPFQVARLKTASYSFVGTIQTGARLADAPAEDAAHLNSLGNSLGIAYQMADDLLGVFGDESVTGKSNVTDLVEEKHTYLMQMTYKHATAGQLAELQRCIKSAQSQPNGMTSAEAALIRDIVISCGAQSIIEDVLTSYCLQANRDIDALHVSASAKQRLQELVAAVSKREY